MKPRKILTTFIYIVLWYCSYLLNTIPLNIQESIYNFHDIVIKLKIGKIVKKGTKVPQWQAIVYFPCHFICKVSVLYKRVGRKKKRNINKWDREL